MKTLLIDILLIFTAPLMLMAQELDGRRWMAGIDDTRTVASLSIPGAHDAATGEGLIMTPGLGKTQELTLAGLWDCGVRAFDLRPAVKDGELHIYHSLIRTKASFSEALDIICDKLKEHPTEFAIVLLREESDSENGTERAQWPTTIGKIINSLGERAAIFSPAMSVGDARGKIIFISRSNYTGCNRGALATGWNHSQQGSLNGRITSYTDGATARLQVQDYYAPTDDAKQRAKESIALQFLDHAAGAPDDVWTINFLSGYCNRWLGVTPFATTSGYKRNAEDIHLVFVDTLSAKPQPTGIVMMDFAGCDSVRGGIWHWGTFETMGAELVKKIIKQNFR